MLLIHKMATVDLAKKSIIGAVFLLWAGFCLAAPKTPQEIHTSQAQVTLSYFAPGFVWTSESFWGIAHIPDAHHFKTRLIPFRLVMKELSKGFLPMALEFDKTPYCQGAYFEFSAYEKQENIFDLYLRSGANPTPSISDTYALVAKLTTAADGWSLYFTKSLDAFSPSLLPGQKFSCDWEVLSNQYLRL